MDQKIIQLYDRFTHGGMDRRQFLECLATLAGGTAAASALLPLLANDYAKAAIVAPDDARIAAQAVTFPGATGEVKGYLAMPKAGGERPAVIVIHENRGVNSHIEDVARRLAVEGYVALAVDYLSPQGGTPADEDKAREMFAKVNFAGAIADSRAAFAWLRAHPATNGRVGVIGFCWGGGGANELVVVEPQLAAAVVYYGRQPGSDRVAAIRAPLLLHYAGLDERINAGIAAYEAALKAGGKSYEMFMYEGVNHAFNNDTGGARYDKAAAELAWSRTVAFFKKHLGGAPGGA